MACDAICTLLSHFIQLAKHSKLYLELKLFFSWSLPPRVVSQTKMKTYLSLNKFEAQIYVISNGP